MRIKLYLFCFIIILFSIAFIYKINQQSYQLENATAYDNIKIIAQKKFKEQEDKSLALALTLARNVMLKKALKNKDKVLGEIVLNDSIEYLENYSNNKTIYVQVYNASNQIFARSFTPDILQPSLEKDSLTHFSKQVESSIEIKENLRLNMSVPIFEQNKFLGVLQVIIPFENYVEALRVFDLEFIPLLDEHLVKHQKKLLKIFNQYVLLHKNSNKSIVNYLNSMKKEWKKELIQNEYIRTRKGLFALYPFVNNKGEIIGKQIFFVASHNIEKFRMNDYTVLESIYNLNATQEDMYNFEKYDKKNMFLNIEQAYIANIVDMVDEKDLNEFEEVARNKLRRLSKEELIDFILQKSSQRKIEGEIR